MAVMFELVWRSEGAERAFPVHGVVTIGRGFGNDLVLPGDQVSYQHSRIWENDGTLWIADAGSTNGTFVGDTRITSKTALEAGKTVRIGTYTLLIRQLEGGSETDTRWVVEDLESGLRRPLGSRFVIGTGADAQLRVEGVEAVLSMGPDGFSLVHGGRQRYVNAEQELVLGPLRLRILQVGQRPMQRTVRPVFSDGWYHVDASLDARVPWARIQDDAGHELEIEGEARATLLFVLARAVLADRENGVNPLEEGWIDDQKVAAQVWGRVGREGVGNKLSVVVYRLRADLKKAGLSASFVERKRGRIRIRGARISLNG